MVHVAERKTGREAKKRVIVSGPRTERERSGSTRAGYVPQSRSYESNLRRKMRAQPRPVRARKGTPASASEQYDDAHRLARRGERSSRIKRTSVYDQEQSYYRKSRGGAAGGFMEGNRGETTARARRGGHADQNRRTQSVANVKDKRGGAARRPLRQSDQGDAGQ